MQLLRPGYSPLDAAHHAIREVALLHFSIPLQAQKKSDRREPVRFRFPGLKVLDSSRPMAVSA
jgi:hypothetical protein